LERILPIPGFVASMAPRTMRDARRLAALAPRRADAIEIRLDFASEPLAPRALLDLDPRCVLLTLRTAREGGGFRGSIEEYRAIVEAAHRAGAHVDVEIGSGLLDDPAFLPDRSRVIASRHGADFDCVEEEGRDMAVRAAVVKRACPEPDTLAGAVSTLHRQRRAADQRPAAVFALGSRGAITRILGARFGAALVYGSIESATGQGQLPIREILDVFRARDASAGKDLFVVYGGDVSRSLSPVIHNALFARRALPALYVPATASARSGANRLTDDAAALERTGLRFRGGSITNPFKAEAARLGSNDREAAAIGAANTIVRKSGAALAFTAHNTDAHAVAQALRNAPDGPALVLGAGGASAAAVFACRRLGRAVVVVARNARRAGELAGRFGVQAAGAESLPEIPAAVLINATPLGAGGDDVVPFPKVLLSRRPRVLDFVYRRVGDTPLARLARECGCQVVDGREMLARQAVRQARRFGVIGASFEEIHALVKERG
jgi:shikimate dehydrogenase/3-dehydroquinate dehydratase type I